MSWCCSKGEEYSVQDVWPHGYTVGRRAGEHGLRGSCPARAGAARFCQGPCLWRPLHSDDTCRRQKTLSLDPVTLVGDCVAIHPPTVVISPQRTPWPGCRASQASDGQRGGKGKRRPAPKRQMTFHPSCFDQLLLVALHAVVGTQNVFVRRPLSC